ncbi:MAG: ATP-grasp domain-containing protein [Ilumatobacteraceae bacterium]|nr:ATP-grasp domain-containing protein [Ilumatobacteraceae bacterium]MBP7887678.1 ATP-grasp domain-containing protein [Ilumatobacteraceae bacterium]
MTMPQRAIHTVLVANRGEISRRIFRTCREQAIATVAVFSDADQHAPFVREAGAAVRLPGTSSADTYLRGDLIIAAAQRFGAAVHPGYGFLSENAAFAQQVIDAGLTWIGPPPAAIAAMGSKIEAKRLMRSHGVPVAPDNTVESLAEIGLPALVKASAGGGGRGMRVVRSDDGLADAIASAQREALAAFGDDTVFVERYLERARHVEIQVLADTHGNVIALHERDCTLQRRHQKVLEEAPSPAVDGDLRVRMEGAAVAAACAVGYVGAGTVEFLLDGDSNFWFLEMNTRLQVEHPVTEAVCGVDLVALQLSIAEGHAIPAELLVEVPLRGHAIEVRLCAEDPYSGYLPSSGVFHTFRFPDIPGVRVDSAIESGSEVPPYYDSMIAKVIAHGATRAEAVRRLTAALRGAELIGPVTNRDLLLELLSWVADFDAPGGPGIDTGLVDRSAEANGGSPIGEPPPHRPIDVAAAALALVQRRSNGNRFPIGWRNNPSQSHVQAVGEHTVRYRFDRADRLQELWVDDQPLALDDDTLISLERTPVVLHDDIAYVRGGVTRFQIPPRFTSPDEAGREGSTVAPMPGRVIALLVAVGDTVVAGQPLLTMEAMKMEHQIVSPHPGIIGEVYIQPGQQLDSGQPLLTVDPA